jgi:hypothetical protein
MVISQFTFRTKPFMDLLNGGEEEVVLKNDNLKHVANACYLALQEQVEDQASLNSLKTILDLKTGLPGTKIQVKPSFNKQDKSILEKVQLIVKWGMYNLCRDPS